MSKRRKSTSTPKTTAAPVAHPPKEIPEGDDAMTTAAVMVNEDPMIGGRLYRRCACCNLMTEAKTCPNCGQASWVK